ncbi:MAG: hypothetical protein H6779_04105 [Candidatus Nomurabacteria bacterium]|nr:MAG: hypothetical protein H6779_04105 [Candidatus Nomurabacteria bacterium]
MKKQFISAYLGLSTGIFPLVCYRVYENYGIRGGLNEVLEGLLLYLLLFIPISIVLVLAAKVLEKMSVKLNNKILFLVSLAIAVIFLYLL